MSEDKVSTGMLGPHFLQVDYFGRILLMRGNKVLQEIDNPAQQQDQKDLLKRHQEAAEQRRENAHIAGIKNLRRKPYEANN